MGVPLTAPVLAMCAVGALFSITCMTVSAVLAWRNYHPEGPTMLSSIKAIFTPKVRLGLYGVAAALLALLVYYRIVDAPAVPFWLTLAGAVLGVAGNTTAAVNLTVQLRARKAAGGAE